MSLSPRQIWELQEKVRLLWNELNQAAQQLDEIGRIRQELGPEVVTALEDLISPGEWQTVHATISNYRDILQERLGTARGEELEPSGELG